MIDANKKAKLRWLARRGMLELDLILESFLEHHLTQLSEKQVDDLEELMSYDDPTIFEWLMGFTQPIKKNLRDLIATFQLHYPTR